MKPGYRLILPILVVATLAGWSRWANAQNGDQRCFAETALCIAGPVRTFWEQNGGMQIFGLPISDLHDESVEGQILQVQWFERARIELHPDQPAPYTILLGRLGIEQLIAQGRDWQSFPQSTPQNGCEYFAQTGHNLCGAFRDAWHAHGLNLPGVDDPEAGNLALWGLPLSDAHVEQLEGGSSFTVQWFERGRLELHPENAPPYDLLAGLLGSELRPTTVAPDETATPEQTQISDTAVLDLTPTEISTAAPHDHDRPHP